MKVLYSNPPWWEGIERCGTMKYWRAGCRAGSRWPFTYLVRSRPDKFVFGDYLPYPFFMGYAASYLREKSNAQVLLRDSIALRESYRAYYNYLKNERFDFIVIESATPSWENDSKIIQNIQAVCPDSKIVLTGPITSTKADEILDRFPVYACIRGEYEKGSFRVVEGEQGLIQHDMLTVKELNEAPFPYFDEVIAHRYADLNPEGQQFPHAQVWSSRGCPYKCIFCVWPATMTGNDPDGTGKRAVRHYSPEYMEAFLRELVERYQFKSIYFDDDTFNLGDRHVVGVCNVMKKIGLPWSAMCRSDTIKLETWGLMKESGCFGVKIGFESGNQYVIDHIVNKRLDLEQASSLVHELKRLGMTVHGTFTYGLPGETQEQMMDTKKLVVSLPFDSVQESGTAEIEGTPLHTLRTAGSLEKYSGAKIDENYVEHSDGIRKWETVLEPGLCDRSRERCAKA